jgi:RHS repeat-associated protein
VVPYGQVSAETDGSNSLVSEHTLGTDRVSLRRSGASHYYLADGQGSTRLLMDSTGTATDSTVYTAFGETLFSSGSTPNDFRYVGEEFDPNAQFYYLRARWMDPGTGRFVGVDPYEGDPQAPISLHRYLYANASPINFIDPSGKMSWSLTNIQTAFVISAVLTGIHINLMQTSPVYRMRWNAVWISLFQSVGNAADYIETADIWDDISLSSRHEKDVIAGLLAHAALHATKIASIPPNGPNDDERGWKVEVKAALERVKRLAEKRLKGKTRDEIISKVEEIAKKAKINLD